MKHAGATKHYKLILGIVFFAVVGTLFFTLRAQGLVPDLSTIKAYREDLIVLVSQHIVIAVVGFTLIYAGVVAASLPFATPLSVLAGFLFGTLTGTAVVVFAASSGATISVIINRFFFREYVEKQFGHRLARLNAELSGNGFRDIFLLRLAPVVPFSLINLFSAVTAVKIRDFFFATFFGILPFSAVYVHAGTQLADIDSLSEIISLETLLVVSLIALSVLIPIFIRRHSKPAISEHESDTRP